MDSIIHAYMYIVSSVAPATFHAYRSALRRYLNFCHQYHLPSFPLSRYNTIRFVAHLAETGMSYQSIRSYLCGIHFMQVVQGFPDPYLSSNPLLGLALCGIHRQPLTTRRQPWLPITPEILQLLFNAWSQWPLERRYDALMLWAAVCTGFFGFIRAGEFTCPSRQAYNPRMLGPQDVSVDSHLNPSIVYVRLRHSKNDPFGAGVTVCLGRTGQAICPVMALLGYLANRRMETRPLFCFQDGSPLLKQKLVTHVRQVLATWGGVDT